MSIDTNEGSSRLTAIRAWMVNHDDSWLFVSLYIGLAVVLSVWISLFWLVAVVAVHFGLEWVRQSHRFYSGRRILLEVLWELKLDIALVLFALALSFYMDLVLGVVGLGSAARMGAVAQAGLRGGSRFAAWEKTLRGILLSVDDAAQVVRAATAGRRAPASKKLQTGASLEFTPTDCLATDPVWGSWGGAWGKGDWVAVGLGILCLALIAFAPWLTEHTVGSVWSTLGTELRPYPLLD